AWRGDAYTQDEPGLWTPTPARPCPARPWSSSDRTPAHSGVARLVPPNVPWTHWPPSNTATPVGGSASIATYGVTGVALLVTPAWYAGLGSYSEGPPPVPMQMLVVQG